MKVCVYGSGFVGLSISTVLSEIGHQVYCIDTNDYRINNIKKGVLDFYEPNLIENVQKCLNNKSLQLYQKHDIELGTDVYIVAIGSQKDEQGAMNIANIKNLVSQIVSSITKYSVIFLMSLVPVGTVEMLNKELKNKTTIDFDIVYNPIFIRHGSAYDDFKNQNRIVIGTKSAQAIKIAKELYKPLKSKIIAMDENSAELTKFANDAFLSVKISFINEIANYASEFGANISSVKKALSLDNRIGKDYLQAGIGFGGEHLNKSLNTLINTADKKKIDLNVIKGARITNENQKRKFISQVLKHYNYNIESKMFTIWGLSFKANTNETRQSPSNTVIDTLIRYGANVRVYDPKAVIDTLKQLKTKEEAVLNSNALIILTDWDEFANPDFEFIAKNLSDKVIFDARNLYIDKDLSKYGLKYYCTGKSNEQ